MTSTTGSQTCLLCERLCRWKQRIHACFTLNIHHGSQTWPVHKSLLWLMWSIHCEFRLDSTLKPETEAPNCDNLEWKRVYGFPCYLMPSVMKSVHYNSNIYPGSSNISWAEGKGWFKTGISHDIIMNNINQVMIHYSEFPIFKYLNSLRIVGETRDDQLASRLMQT